MKKNEKPLFRRDNTILAVIAVASVLFQLYFYNSLGFHRDELLYFSLGQHLSLGYHSVPPMVGLLAFVSAKLFGYTLFAAKFLPAIAGGVLIYVSGQIARELTGGTFARIFTATGIFGSILFLRSFGLFQPVCFDILCWTLSFYLILRYINTENNKFIYLLGLILGLAFLNKYNIVFLVLPLLIALPFSRFRRLFGEKPFYTALLIAFVVFLPNLVWQIAHSFPVIEHMKELHRTQLVNVSASEFFGEQLLMIYPATILAVPGMLYLFVSKKMRPFLLPASMSVLVLLLFLLFHGKGYYAAGIYPFLIAAGGVFYENVLKKNYLRIPLLLAVLFLSWTILPVGKPIYPPEKLVGYFDYIQALTGDNSSRRFEDNSYRQLPQDYADMLGWDDFASLVNRAWQQVDDKKSCIIFCDNYGEAGAIAILGKKYGLPEPLSFSDAFRYWIPEKFDHEINTLIYINSEPGQDVKDLFSDIQKIGQIDNPLAREYGVGVYLCRNPQSNLNEFWEQAVKKVNGQ